MDKKKEHLKSIEVLIDQLELSDDEEEETGKCCATGCLPTSGPDISNDLVPSLGAIAQPQSANRPNIPSVSSTSRLTKCNCWHTRH